MSVLANFIFKNKPDLKARLAEISESLNAEVVAFIGDVHPDTLQALRRELLEACRNRKYPNILFIPVSFGGSADGAFRIARLLQRAVRLPNDEGLLRVFVDSYCKSAGTLFAISGDELIMSDFAELGPLDVQLEKPGEIGERRSGLVPTQALLKLRRESLEFIQEFTVDLRTGALHLPTRVAADLAAQIVVGLFGKVYEQFDPLDLGENERNVLIAQQYGMRLGRTSGNLKDDALSSLLSGYPAHGFAIDREEAENLFLNIHPPSAEEAEVGAMLEAVSELYFRSSAKDGSGGFGPFIANLTRYCQGEDHHEKEPESRAEEGAASDQQGVSGGDPNGAQGTEGSNSEATVRARPA